MALRVHAQELQSAPSLNREPMPMELMQELASRLQQYAADENMEGAPARHGFLCLCPLRAARNGMTALASPGGGKIRSKEDVLLGLHRPFLSSC